MKEGRCGGGIFSTDRRDPFHEACIRHDEGYVKKDQPKQVVDEVFFAEMEQIASRNPSWLGRQTLRARAALYARIVRLFGGYFW